MSELDKYKKQNPFTVPEGFFENFRGEVMETIRREEKRRLFRRRVAFLSSAAAVVVMLLVVSLFWKTAPADELVANATPTTSVVDIQDNSQISEITKNENVTSTPEQKALIAENQTTTKPVRTVTPPSHKVETERNGEITSSIMEEYSEELEQELYCDALLDLDLYLELCYEY